MIVTREREKQGHSLAAQAKVNHAEANLNLNPCEGCNTCHQMTSIHRVGNMTAWSGEGGEEPYLNKPCAANFFQQNLGNSYLQSIAGDIPAIGKIQAKLTIGQPDDTYEQEADRVAEQVMRMPEPRYPEKKEDESIQTKPIASQITSLIQRQEEPEEEEEEEGEGEIQTKPIASQITPLVQRQVEPEEEKEEEEEETVQTKEVPGKTPAVSPTIESYTHSLRGGGQPLDRETRAFMEPRFGHDFSQVRVHTDAKATESARLLNALAYTVGREVVFGTGRYAPASADGRSLLAHELTHVIQQQAIPIVSDRQHLNQGIVSFKTMTTLIQCHRTIRQSVAKFKGKIGNQRLLETGQFYWSTKLSDSIKDRYTSVLNDPSWLQTQELQTKKDNLKILFDNLRELSYYYPERKAAITNERQKALRDLNNSGNPLARSRDLLGLLDDGHFGTKSYGKSLFYSLWPQSRRSRSIPPLSTLESFAKLQGLGLYERVACGVAAVRVAGYFFQEGGFAIGGRQTTNKLLNTPVCQIVYAGRKPTAGAMGEGHVVIYGGNLDSATQKLRNALDDNYIIHARVLSGAYHGGDEPVRQPKCKEEHSILIIGYDGDKFVFWDPDSSTSHEFGGGFGFLYYDGSVPRLSTAENSGDLVVNEEGYHLRGQHRYQVLRMWSI